MIPAILSDIAVTVRNSPSARRPMQGTPFGREIFVTSHARKNYILSDKTAITMAGNVDEIQRFADDVTNNISAIERLDRPSRKISEIANSYPNIQVLSSYVDYDFQRSIAENHAFCRHDSHISRSFKNDVYGVFRTAGTGGERMIKKLLENEANSLAAFEISRRLFQEEAVAEHPTATEDQFSWVASIYAAHQMTKGLFSAICASYLVNELNGVIRPDHGGFFEGLLFHPHQAKWTRQNSTVYFFYELDQNGPKRVIKPVDLILAYEPAERFGSILVYKDRKLGLHILESLLDPIALGEEFQSPFFNDWQPKEAVVVFVTRKGGRDYRFLGSKATTDRERKHISFDLVGGGPSGMSEEWFKTSFPGS